MAEDKTPDMSNDMAQDKMAEDKAADRDTPPQDTVAAPGDAPQRDDAAPLDAGLDEAKADTPQADQPQADAPEKAQQDTPAEPAVEDVRSEEKMPEDAEPAQNAETDTPRPDADPAPVAPAPAPQEPQRGSFIPLVLGGIIAGVIGFLAAGMDFFDTGEDMTAQLRNDLTAQQERLVALEQAEPPVIDIPAVDLSGIEAQLAQVEDRIAALEARPAVILPDGGDADAAAAYAAELEALRSSVETQRSEIEALLNNARSVEEATAQAALAASGQTALAKIVSAIDAGQPYADAFSDLSALDIDGIDPALGASAESGVATLGFLQTEFPEQARTALAAARASGVGEGQEGIGGFLTRSLGARSVAPREGDDPDAVLSRAEAALKSGDLNAALDELDTLPQEAQTAMADWRAAADARVAARAAADALAQRLTAD